MPDQIPPTKENVLTLWNVVLDNLVCGDKYDLDIEPLVLFSQMFAHVNSVRPFWMTASDKCKASLGKVCHS